MSLIKCPECGNQVSSNAAACPRCGQPFKPVNNDIVKCPRCGSTNVKVISGASKAASIVMWGVFAANKVINHYECRECHHKF